MDEEKSKREIKSGEIISEIFNKEKEAYLNIDYAYIQSGKYFIIVVSYVQP